MKTDTLADWVHAWTYDTRTVHEYVDRVHVKFAHNRRARAWQAVRKLELRQAMREAKRYRLNDDFVRLIAPKTMGQPTDMLAMGNLAQLPHDRVFIEYDDGVRVRAVHDEAVKAGGTYHYDPETDYGRAGLLIERRHDSNSPHEWMVTHFSDSEGSLPCWPYSATFSLDRDVRLATNAGEKFSRSDWIQHLQMSGWGYVDNRKDGLGYAIHEELLERGVAMPEPRFFLPTIRGLINATDHMPEDEAEQVTEAIKHAVVNYAAQGSGKLRWAVSILSSINVVPTLMINHSAKGSFTHRMKNVPRLAWSTIHIDARPGHELRVYEHHMSEATGRHNRWHEVRGHWRVVDTRKPGGPRIRFLCGHEVAERDGLYALCGKCGHLIRWVDRHERGDERLGKVFHDYEVDG